MWQSVQYCVLSLSLYMYSPTSPTRGARKRPIGAEVEYLDGRVQPGLVLGALVAPDEVAGTVSNVSRTARPRRRPVPAAGPRGLRSRRSRPESSSRSIREPRMSHRPPPSEWSTKQAHFGDRPAPGDRIYVSKYSGQTLYGDDRELYRVMDSRCIGARKLSA